MTLQSRTSGQVSQTSQPVPERASNCTDYRATDRTSGQVSQTSQPVSERASNCTDYRATDRTSVYIG